MSSVNSELSTLLTKMGGEPLETDSNSDLIRKISDAYESGGSESNLVCWARPLPGDSYSRGYSLSKTAREIIEAHLSGKSVLIISKRELDDISLPLLFTGTVISTFEDDGYVHDEYDKCYCINVALGATIGRIVDGIYTFIALSIDDYPVFEFSATQQ